MRDEYDFSKGIKARKVLKDIKITKTLRLDPDIVGWLEREGKKQGMGYQTYLNWFLRKSMDSQENFEERLVKLEKIVLRKKA
ncbi:MAG: BrnA antitoxin family protein [Bacteriovorax sp.]|nr:BrnA antitoxin family protein [Bacteriovorax sp.]